MQIPVLVLNIINSAIIHSHFKVLRNIGGTRIPLLCSLIIRMICIYSHFKLEYSDAAIVVCHLGLDTNMNNIQHIRVLEVE